MMSECHFKVRPGEECADHALESPRLNPANEFFQTPLATVLRVLDEAAH